MINATNISLKNGQDNTFVFFNENNEMLTANNYYVKEIFAEYYIHMQNMLSDIKIFKMPSASMENSINKNEYILAIMYQRKLKRGDLAVFKHKNNMYVKRCIATGGDIVFLKNKDLYLHPSEGNQFVTDNYQEKDYVKLENRLWIVNPFKKDYPGIHNNPKVILDDEIYPHSLFDMSPVKIQNKEFFLLGDNRDHSYDSRFIGSIPQSSIIGYPIILKFKNK